LKASATLKNEENREKPLRVSAGVRCRLGTRCAHSIHSTVPLNRLNRRRFCCRLTRKKSPLRIPMRNRRCVRERALPVLEAELRHGQKFRPVLAELWEIPEHSAFLGHA